MEKLYSVKDLQELLGISRGHAYALLSDGELPYVREGKCLRVREVDLAAYLERNLVPAAP